jgi:hypothetical protein
VQPFLLKSCYSRVIPVVLSAVNTAITARLVTHRIRTHILDLGPAKKKVRLGHQHLIVHVFNRRPMALVAGNTHIQMDCRDILGLQTGVADVTLGIAAWFFTISFFGLWLACETHRQHTDRSYEDKNHT